MRGGIETANSKTKGGRPKSSNKARVSPLPAAPHPPPAPPLKRNGDPGSCVRESFPEMAVSVLLAGSSREAEWGETEAGPAANHCLICSVRCSLIGWR